MQASQAAPWIILTHIETPEENLDQVMQEIRKPRRIDPILPRAVYRQSESSMVLELVASRGPADIGWIAEDPEVSAFEDRVRPLLEKDFRREALYLKEVVIPNETPFPTTKRLQLRHIEVPPHRLDEYHEWRERTIFAHVRRRKDIDSFAAYHSAISTEPGVLFVVGFSNSPEELAAGFDTPEYRDIVQQANRYIVGGSTNLYTKIYDLVEVLGTESSDSPAGGE